ncbi:MAG: bifunctional helix-turn-helix transcriptional regulator/GNAT family N-acetyltransferase [Candidatus Aminicenantes bacterium]|jgi:DNA-binding MarR family transcriptional regulator/N-acetylglutamate synthase-like GNAT family acetyltransferase
MDFIKELGYLAIATRMKRLTDRLMRGAIEAYQSFDIDFEPRWFALFYLLHSQGSALSISEIAQSLKISHPAVIQISQMLIKKDLIESIQDDADRRIRRLKLTDKGIGLASALEPIWNDFEIATARMLDSAGVDILDVIRKIESELDKESISERIIKQIKERQYNAVEIFDFSYEYRDYFKTLNIEWLEKYFEVEEEDLKILANPESEIIRKGGYIFFARLDGEVVGTGALLYVDGETYEIVKMAVTERAQGNQVGKRLTAALIDKAKEEGAKSIILKTDNKLWAAVNLYRKFGFKVTVGEKSASGIFDREKCGLLMKLELV